MLKHMLTTTLAASALVLTACASTTSTGGDGARLTLVEPADQTLVRGETNDLAILIRRSNHSGPLALDFDDLPDGIEVVQEDPRVDDGGSMATVTLYAEPDADLTEGHPVRVTARAENGLEVSEWFEISIRAN